MDITSVERPVLMEKLLKIDNKHRQVVPFTPNNVQLELLHKKGKRGIILKARQLGISSLILADMFLECITVPNTTCVVVSHEQHATERLLARVHFFYENFPDPKPTIGHASAYEITFPIMHSTIYIGTARSMTFGRGDRIDRAHLSELSQYEDGERILNAVEEAVPLDGELLIESTPAGENNTFYEQWVKASEGKSGYKAFFFPWWMGKDFAIPEGNPLALPPDRGKLRYAPDEEKLVKLHKLTPDQIRWRRRKIADKGALFYQEYPEDSISCFLQSGEPVFDPNILSDMATLCYPGEWHSPGFYLWKEPIEKNHYVIGADCSAGVEKGSYSAAAVLDESYTVCATFQARAEPSQFASILAEMGKYYNNAMVVVERNAQGYAVLAKLVDYPNIYRQRDYTTGRQTDRVGWWTSEQTKGYMITSFRNTLPRVKTWDANLVRQARGYTYIKFKPITQGFDDLLVATMIAVAVKQVEGGSRGYIGSAQKWDW